MDEPLNAGHRIQGMRWVLWLAMGITVAVSLAVAVRRPVQPLFELGNLVGPTTESLLHGGGLTACTEAMGTPGNPICFHAGRMPIASGVVGAGIRVFGSSPRRVVVFKTLLFLLPIEGAIWLVWAREVRRWLVWGLLVAPFGTPAFLADVVNLQVEEGIRIVCWRWLWGCCCFATAERDGLGDGRFCLRWRWTGFIWPRAAWWRLWRC